jgi:DNA-3-methyladenine glycosylase
VRGDRHDWLADLLARPVLDVAPALLGCRVRAGGVTVRLTEVEAYDGQGLDPGSHAHRGPTARNQVMFGPPGRAYVYFSYGMHWCLNVVTGPDGVATAVLLRAGEVVDGLEPARSRRPASRRDEDLARGPARLAAALGVDGSFGGVDLLDPRSALRLLPAAADRSGPHAAIAAGRLRTGPRVGLSAAADLPWRFWLAGEPSVSRYRAAGQVRRARQSPP